MTFAKALPHFKVDAFTSVAGCYRQRAMTDAAQRGSWSPNVMDVIVAERDERRHSLSPCCGDWPPNYACASRLSKTLPLSGTGRLTDCLALLAPVACQTRHSTLAAKLVMRLSMSDH